MKKNNKLPGNKIFSFDDLSEDKLYQTHIDLISNDIHCEELNPVIKSVLNQNNDIPIEKKSPKVIPREKELLEKYQYLIHLLITKSFYKGYVELPASLYQDLFGNHYNIMLRVLSNLGYIHRNGYYKKGSSYMRITLLKENIQCRVKYIYSFEKCRSRFLTVKEKRTIERHNKMVGLFGNNFVKSYLINLSQLKLVDEIGARSIIDNDSSSTEYAKMKNHYTLDRYNEREFSIGYDKNNRLYTILTNTNRNLKKYLNIWYQIDISNCHPVLLNYTIINHFNISINVLNRIYDIIYSNILYSQYDTKLFCKLLEDTKINCSDFPGLKQDHLLYIYLTSVGKFWDFIMLQDELNGESRDTVKERMFQEVFYSKSLRGKNMSYQRIFKKFFPSVFKIILEQRRKFRAGLDTHLANKLMSLESEIIQSVLSNLFEEGFNVINIHDAIVVLDTVDNLKLTPEYIQELIRFEFQKKHMFASTKVDYYKYYPNRYFPK